MAEHLRKEEYSIDAQELRALSVPSSLLFLLGTECDIALCASHVGSKRKFSLRFSAPLCAHAKRLLECCSTRMGLTCQHGDGHSTVSGVGKLPVLRYVDFLPGQLHTDEILASFGNKKPLTQPVPVVDGTGNNSCHFTASFIDYSLYVDEAVFADTTNGSGYCMQLERGLSLATHGHLVAIRFQPSTKRSIGDQIASFQRFCGWSRFDLRFEDEATRRAGVIVMPTIQDAMDVFEKYEDEDSDMEDDDALPFSLRPVAPMVPVPYVEDAQVRKFRQQHWNLIVQAWDVFPKTRFCVVVSNLYDKASLPDVLKLFEGLNITESSMVEDASPFRRRRAFITFQDANGCREALCLDGKNTHGKALRIQVSPPYVDAQRRGVLVRSRSPSPSPQATPQATTGSIGRQPSPIPDLQLPEAITPVSATPTNGMSASHPPKPKKSSESRSPQTKPAPSTTAASPSPKTSAATATAPKTTTTPVAAPPSSAATPPPPPAQPAAGATAAAAADTDQNGVKKPAGMNAAAKEFVPKFATSPLMSSAAPLPPPAYNSTALPPAYVPAVAQAITSPHQPPAYTPPPPYAVTPQSSGTKPQSSPQPLPPYALPPPYAKSPIISSALPPPYVPQGSGTVAPPPPPAAAAAAAAVPSSTGKHTDPTTTTK